MTDRRTASSAMPTCRGCGGDLDLSQPDESRPRWLLGVCRDCRGWWLLVFPASRWKHPGTLPVMTRVDVDAAAADQDRLTTV